MRLTLDKVFGTCLEFHPSQFYNRMNEDAEKSSIFSFFCCFVAEVVPNHWRFIIAYVVYYSFAFTMFIIICPFSIDFTYRNPNEMRSFRNE